MAQGSRAGGSAPPPRTDPEREARKPRGKDPLARLRGQLRQIEDRLEALGRERHILDADEAAGLVHPNRRANLERDAATLETQWLEVGTALEAAEAKLCESGS